MTNGALVYVGGPSLAITSLANLLVDAGAVRAMELDINPDWVQYSTYAGAPGASSTGRERDEPRALDGGRAVALLRTWWIRDFYTMSVRPSPDPRLLAPLP